MFCLERVFALQGKRRPSGKSALDVKVGQHVVEQFPAVVRGDGDVVGGDPGAVQGLHAEDVAVGAVVGEDAGVGDAEALEVVGQEGRRWVLQG